jgi:acetyl-CoA C-acetyltransferase
MEESAIHASIATPRFLTIGEGTSEILKLDRTPHGATRMTESNDVYILGAARTPIGKMMGGLATIPATQLGAVATKAALERSGVDAGVVDEVILGQVVQAGVGQAPARQASIAAGIPTSANATTLNKVCASGLEAINQAGHAIRAGDSTVVVAGGMESMSQGPHLLPKARFGYRMGSATMLDAVVHDGLWSPWDDHHMGMSAEAIAEKRGISRLEQDEFALRSHQRAVAAMNAGRFKAEITPVAIEGRKGQTIDTDEGRARYHRQALGRLQPAFTQAAPSPWQRAGFTDGAAAVVVAGRETVDAHGLQPMARVLGYASAATGPLWLFEAPELALRKLFRRPPPIWGTGTCRDQRGVRGADRGQWQGHGLGLGPRQRERRRDCARASARGDRRATGGDAAARAEGARQEPWDCRAMSWRRRCRGHGLRAGLRAQDDGYHC